MVVLGGVEEGLGSFELGVFIEVGVFLRSNFELFVAGFGDFRGTEFTDGEGGVTL